MKSYKEMSKEDIPTIVKSRPIHGENQNSVLLKMDKVRLYDYLLNDEEGAVNGDFIASLNPNSLVVLDNCKVEPSVKWAAPGTKFQFLRQGYFCVDKDSTMDNLVFNRVVGLRDTWSKVAKKG